jgi:hypothetical protein
MNAEPLGTTMSTPRPAPDRRAPLDTPRSRRGFVRASAGIVGVLAASGAVAPPVAAQDATPLATPAAASPWPPVGAETTSIDLGAPVMAHHEIAIGAPLDVVWDLFVDVEAWTSWNPDITAVVLERPIAAGASFRWETAGISIRSTIYAMTERAMLLWGGPTIGILGVHQWLFTETAGGVLVRTRESWSGEPVEVDIAYAQDQLDASIVSWLQHLKTAAEAKA